MIKEFLIKLFHPPEYPKELKTTKAKVAYWWLWHERCTDTGRGKVIGKVTQMFQEFGLFLLLIDKLGYATLSLPQMGIIVLIGAFCVWTSGWVYMVLRIDLIGAILNRYRDPMFKTMHDTIEKLDEGKKQ